MDKKKALEKIKKCLALAKSSNEHEAAQALKQAQALMREFEVSEQDVDWLEVNEQCKPFTYDPSTWQSLLVQMCGEAFGCRYYINKSWSLKDKKTSSKINFVGLGARAELAVYAFEVLSRQIREARSSYKKTTLNRVRVRKNLMFRLDEFSYGWVASVYKLIDVFANQPKEQAILDTYMKEKHPNIKSRVIKDKKASGHVQNQAANDFSNGLKEGKKAQLHHAMQQPTRKQLEVK